MKEITTLVPDILSLFGDDRGTIDPDRLVDFTNALTKKVGFRLSEQRQGGSLRLSSIGKKCDKKLWLDVNSVYPPEPLPPEAKIKFLYGDLLEEMLLYLAREAGHTVEREQEEVTLHGVVGHIDAVIDGVLVDCKSASSYAFEKFSVGLQPDLDDFGYLGQLDSYLHATGIALGGFLVIDKTLGKICLDLHNRSDRDWGAVVQSKRDVLQSPSPPPRAFDSVADGKSGNEKLGTTCSYCDRKHECWPGLRTFIYSTGPRYLTTVRRTPEVPEV